MARKLKTTEPKPAEAPKPPPERTAEEMALAETWKKRSRLQRPPKVKPGATETAVAPTTEDHALWLARLGKAVGTEDQDLMLRLAIQAADCVRGGNAAEKHNLAVAGMHGVGPQDGVEGMLAAQMVATHHAAMAFLKNAGNAEWIDHMTAAGGMAVKLLRTFSAQVEALGRWRNGGRQQVIVQHQHVAVTAEKAAVAIGTLPGVGGGMVEMGGQAHGTDAITYEPGAEVWCANAPGNDVSGTSGQRAEAMPAARVRPR